MKKFFLSFTLFVASAAYVAYQYMGGGTTTPVAKTTGNTSATAPIAQQSNTQNANTNNQPMLKPKDQYMDGTYTGSVADAYYGNVQVQAIIQGRKLTDVVFLQYPNDRRTSQYINSQAMPQLRQESIQAQSANVSGVSGASDTSAAFRESLSNALSKANN